MTLEQFLAVNTPLNNVELLPDSRLINVVIGDGALYGVQVDNIPDNVTVTRVEATYVAPIITAANALTFDAREYVMLESDPAV
jgi:hypothetical protein